MARIHTWEISDERWTIVEPLIPKPEGSGIKHKHTNVKQDMVETASILIGHLLSLATGLIALNRVVIYGETLNMPKNVFKLIWRIGLCTIAMVTAVFFCSSIVSAGEVEIFVASNGYDTAPGTRDKPVATLNQAKVLWNTAAKQSDVDKIKVWMRGGNYAFTETFVIEDADRKVPVHIAAYGDEKPILYGSRTITGWQSSKRFPGGIVETKLDEATLKTFVPIWWEPCSLSMA